MRKTLGGIKHHWRPVYNQDASHSTNNANYQTVLDISGRGKAAIFTSGYGWIAGDFYTEVSIDGAATYLFFAVGRYNIIRCDFHFNTSIRVRHKTSVRDIRTCVAYWLI